MNLILYVVFPTLGKPGGAARAAEGTEKRARQEAKQAAKQAAKNAWKQERTAWKRRKKRIVKVGMLVCMLRRSFVA